MAPASSLLLLVISHLAVLSLAEGKTRYYQRCPPFPCGILGSIKFPFSNRTNPECGLFVVDNCNHQNGPKIQLGKDGPQFLVRNIKMDRTLHLHGLGDEKPGQNCSCMSLKNLTLATTAYLSYNITSKGTLFKCPSTQTVGGSEDTKSYKFCNESSHSLVHSTSGFYSHNCSLIPLLVKRTPNGVEFLNLFTRSFDLQVNVTQECTQCHERGSQCQSDDKGNFHCSSAETGNAKGHIIVVVVAITTSGIGVLIILALCFKKRLLSINFMVISGKKCKNYQNVETFLKNHGILALKRYNYSDIKRMTNSFKHKLGQGGYGEVFKGKLLDGRDVAIKVLNGAKGNGEDFINEVASISRTSHVNIVGLFGYCFESNRRALIYEFVPNGSLEKFIYKKYSTYKHLKWEKLYQIALGIARGLEYLHRGCSTRIVHFDIKPHNILLDEDFCPKISDFGLAKICPRKESIISMTGARGTIGYIAPEVFCRNFGEVSHKSYVYSYGMMILEMVGGRKNLDVGVGQTSQIYFPYWIYERLEVDEELGLQGIENEEENKCARKMLIVSLWCIQTNPSSRPTMSRVVELLEANLDSLQFPPKPFLFTPRSETADSLPSLVW